MKALHCCYIIGTTRHCRWRRFMSVILPLRQSKSFVMLPTRCCAWLTTLLACLVVVATACLQITRKAPCGWSWVPCSKKHVIIVTCKFPPLHNFCHQAPGKQPCSVEQGILICPPALLRPSQSPSCSPHAPPEGRPFE